MLQLKVINHKMLFKKDCGSDRTGSEEDRRRGSARLEPGASSGAAALRANSPRLLGRHPASEALARAAPSPLHVPRPRASLTAEKKSSAPTRHLAQRKRGEMVMPRRLRRRRGPTLICRHQKQKAALAVAGKFRPLRKRRKDPSSRRTSLTLHSAPFSSLSTALTPMNLCLLVPLAAGGGMVNP